MNKELSYIIRYMICNIIIYVESIIFIFKGDTFDLKMMIIFLIIFGIVKDIYVLIDRYMKMKRGINYVRKYSYANYRIIE